MAKQFIDLSRYFTGTQQRPNLRVLLNPDTSEIVKQRRASDRFDFWSGAGDLDIGTFLGSSFARHFSLPSDIFKAGKIEQVQSSLKSKYGMDLGQFLQATPQRRQQAFNKTTRVFNADGSRRVDPGPLIDPKTGLPNRPPESPEEAMFMQWKAFEANRQQNLGLLKNSVATLRYGLGAVARGGPFSSATMQNPLISQLANTYMNTQFEAPDLSYFLRPDVPGFGQGGQFGGVGSGGDRYPQPIPTIPGIGGGGTRPGNQNLIGPAGGVGSSFSGFNFNAPGTPKDPVVPGLIAPALRF